MKKHWTQWAGCAAVLLGALATVSAVAAEAATGAAMSRGLNPELVNLFGTGGMIAALVWAVRYLAARLEALETRMIRLMETTVERNTEVLIQVREAMHASGGRGDTEHFRARNPAPVEGGKGWP